MVRTSFTLSPRGGLTGGFHPGLSRLAVFSWLFARSRGTGGEFHLRLEDTDTEAKTSPDNAQYTDVLKWLGLDWDGVSSQSARMGHYENVASRLIKEGRAYPCYCTLQEIEERNSRKDGQTQQHHYDGKCRELTGSEIQKFEAEGRKPSIRFMAYNVDFSYNDFRKGNILIPSGTVGDFIILRSNKSPIGFFAEAADHFETGVTHLFRNEEHPSATVRQLMLYRSLAMEAPVLYFLPSLTDTVGRKVQNTAPEADALAAGYLPEAVLNHLALLGWASPDGRQLLGKEDLIRLFTPDGLLSQPAVFDRSLLDWMSRHYIINANLETVFERTLPYFLNAPSSVRDIFEDPGKQDFVRNAVDLVRGYCDNLTEIMEHTIYFLSDEYPFNGEAKNLLGKKESEKVLSAFAEWIGKNERNMDENLFGELIADLAKRTELKGKALYQTLKAALTGRTDGPDIYYLVPVIGKENTLKRIAHAAAVRRPA
jgi:nondiscriminating glutamyl-tRNA synthetase